MTYLINLNTKQLNLIGKIKSFTINNTILRDKGNSLNSPLYGFIIEIEFSEIYPAADLISTNSNVWFSNHTKRISNVLVSFETLLDIMEYSSTDKDSWKKEVILLDSSDKYLDKDTTKLLSILLVLSKKDPFKVSYQSLCIEINKTIFIIYSLGEKRNFNHLIEEDIRKVLGYNSISKLSNQLPYILRLTKQNIYRDNDTIILEDGSINYKGNNYRNISSIIYDIQFIKEHIVPLIKI